MKIIYEMDQDNLVTLTLAGEGKVNLLGSALVAAWEEAVTRLEGEQDLRGVILTSAKQDFIAGANLDELYALNTAESAMALGQRLRRAMRRFESLGKPVVAALNGSALGGGYEIALTCHHRILLQHPKIRIGFPEVSLGLFPSAGGSQRLPRLIGIQAALEIMLEGRLLDPAAALAAGLVDELAPTRDALIAQAKTWIASHPDARQPWDLPEFRWPGGASSTPALAAFWSMAPSVSAKRTRGNYPNHSDALAAVYEGSLVDFDTADRIECRYFAHTVTSAVAKNMLAAFWYQLNHLKRGGSRPASIPVTRLSLVGVLGAGMMGRGIAFAAASSGLRVVLKDISLELAQQGLDHARALLNKKLAQGRISPEACAEILARIEPTDQVADFSLCDLVIEAVYEDRALKAQVTRETEQQLAPSAVFASNTSTLPISDLALATRRPQQFIGLHFFSPVDKMQLVEIIVGKQTSPQTLALAYDFVLALGKVPIVVNDSRGFYTSRVVSAYLDEGMAMLGEGVHPRAIESAALQAGMPVGPLALADELSLTLIRQIRIQTQADLEAEGKTCAAKLSDPILEHMIALARTGKKVGAGFYSYLEDGKMLMPQLGDYFPLSPQQPEQAELSERLMFRQVVETLHCLDEGVLRHVADANLGAILGWGFAPFKGGTLQFICDYGLDAFEERAKHLVQKFGDRFNFDRLRPLADRFNQFRFPEIP